MPTEQVIRAQFAPWSTNDPLPFFAALPENISFTVCGSLNPLRGHYTTRDQVTETFGKLVSRFVEMPTGRVTNVIASSEFGVVEMLNEGVTKGGFNFSQSMCWICRYVGDECVEIRIYVDSAAEKHIFEENV